MSEKVASHYETGGLLDRILAGLAAAGKDIDRLTIDDLGPVDEFHSRRRRATEELGRMLAPLATDHVIDVGSGLGGPSRYLAKTFGCKVSGVDLTPAFVATATALTQLTGLMDRVDFRHGSALDIPFPNAVFDLAWSQNVAMNIEDRARYYAEMRRVLKPGGRLAIQDVAQGPGGVVVFPVMWADRVEISFLHAPDETRRLLEEAGFRVLQWIDNSEAALLEAQAERDQARASGASGLPPLGLPPLGIHLIVGASAREKMRNGQRNQEERRTLLINAVLERVG